MSYECLSYRTVESQNVFDPQFSPFSIFSYSNYACAPSSLSNQFFKENPIPRTSGYIQATLLGGTIYYGLCETSNDCVNASNQCIRHNTGSPHLLCNQNSWMRCSTSENTGRIVQNKACIPKPDRSDAQWTSIPSGKFFIASSYANSGSAPEAKSYGMCSTASSCVNANGRCFTSDTGSPHLHCENKNWKSCGATSVGTKSGSRTCSPITASGTKDYQWNGLKNLN